jgi:hypothetical protein
LDKEGTSEKATMGVVEKLAKLGITTREKKILVMEDETKEEENSLKFVVAGKVLFGEKFHIQTIDSAFESAYFVSLMFCVLDNNIRNFKCVLSGADFTAQEIPGRIIRPGAGYSALPVRHQKNG